MDIQANTDINKQFARLQFKNERRWVSLPSWARFFLELRASLAGFHEEKKKYVAALALPTRSYAATFIGSGLAYANVFLHPDENLQHIELIYSLPEGTSVKFLDNGKLKKAIKQDIKSYNNVLLVGIQIEGEGNATKYIRPENLYKIKISDRTYDYLPNRQKGRDVNPPSELLNEILPGKAHEYIFQTRIDGIIVGSFIALKHESLTPLAVITNDGKECRGILNELFRLKGLNPASSGHRFLLQPSTSNEPIALPTELAPYATVIFDDALAFSKWHEIYTKHNWIVILDHTEPNFHNAVNQINQEYLYRSDSVLKTSPPPLPSGIEMMLFVKDI